MGSFAVGKKALGISDRSGFQYLQKNMRKEWNGLLVGKDEWESKHPQLFPRKKISDPEAIKDPRPGRTEPTVLILLSPNPFFNAAVNSNILTVREPTHGRSTSDVVRFRNAQEFQGFTSDALNLSTGYTITVTSVDEYTITVTTPSPYFAVNPYDSVDTTGNVSTAIAAGALGYQPQFTEFTVEINGRKLGDVNGDDSGSRGITVRDSLSYLKWNINTNEDADEVSYIETIMNPYMFANFATYTQYIRTSNIENSRGGGTSCSAGPVTLES